MSNLIQKGRHLAVCRSIQIASVGEGDNEKEQAVVGFEITDGVDVGRYHSGFFFFTEKTWERTIEAFRHMGWQGDELAELPALAESGALSEPVELVVDHEEYNGEWQAKIRWVNKPGGGMVKVKKPLEGRALASFSASMKLKMKSSTAGAKPASNGQKPSAPKHPNAPGGQDDIPF